MLGSLMLAGSLLVNLGAIAALVVSGGGGHGSFERAEDEKPQMKEVWSYGAGKVKAVRIGLRGVIMRESDGGFFGAAEFDRVERLLRQIRAAQNDEDVRAIILEVDSPGGGIGPSDELYHALGEFRQSAPGRKVVVHVKDLAASGGYYVAMASDWIVAEPTAIIGSIGVIMQTINWKGLSEKIGIRDVTIASGANKDLLNPFKEVSTNQLALLHELVDTDQARFFTLVCEGRKLDPELFRPLADGRIFSAEKAVELKLIDALGYWPDTVRKTAELLGEKSVQVVRYEEHTSFARLLSEIRAPSLDLKLPVGLDAETPRRLYLWRP